MGYPIAPSLRIALGAALLIATATFAAPAYAQAAGGQALFKAQCGACHSTEPSKNRLAPTVAGIAGRKAGSVAGYAYSPAMKNSNLKWDKANLERFLANPRQTVPGTKMMYAGQKDPAKRSALVAYLLTLK